MSYRYYSTERPVAPGTFPRSATVKRIANFDDKQEIGNTGVSAWGYIDYLTPLTAKEAADYELVPAENLGLIYCTIEMG